MFLPAFPRFRAVASWRGHWATYRGGSASASNRLPYSEAGCLSSSPVSDSEKSSTQFSRHTAVRSRARQGVSRLLSSRSRSTFGDTFVLDARSPFVHAQRPHAATSRSTTRVGSRKIALVPEKATNGSRGSGSSSASTMPSGHSGGPGEFTPEIQLLPRRQAAKTTSPNVKVAT